MITKPWRGTPPSSPLPALLLACAGLLLAAACRGQAQKTETPEESLPKSGLVDPGNVVSPGEPGVADVLFELNATRGARPISPLIYGINYKLDNAHEQRWGLVRCGGNRMTAYNWETNASNAGSDWNHQNDGLVSTSEAPAKPFLDSIDLATKLQAATLVTISNADYVAADKKGDGDVRFSGKDYLEKRFMKNRPKKPGSFTGAPDVKDNVVYQDELVSFLKVQRPKAKLLFSMDNEPELWSHTHATIFPKPVTYADLWRRNYEYAKAVKDAWPGAEVLGLVSYGYTGFQSLQNASDAGGRNLLEWYLDQAKAAEAKEKKRIIDYLDLHWYPEATGGGERITTESTSPAAIAARVQAPRSLWDPKYVEDSWVKDAAGGAVDLLHWVQAKIDKHYPGTKLAITEWNYGAGNHISGAVATADVLGIFGRYGVGLAAYWPLYQTEAFSFAAFRAYRNFDGHGAAFGDTTIAATNSDPKVASVYAAADRANPSRVTVIMVNKATAPKRAGVKLTHVTVYGTAKVYQLTAEKPEIVGKEPIAAVAPNAFNYVMPPLSVTVLLLAP